MGSFRRLATSLTFSNNWCSGRPLGSHAPPLAHPLRSPAPTHDADGTREATSRRRSRRSERFSSAKACSVLTFKPTRPPRRSCVRVPRHTLRGSAGACAGVPAARCVNHWKVACTVPRLRRRNQRPCAGDRAVPVTARERPPSTCAFVHLRLRPPRSECAVQLHRSLNGRSPAQQHRRGLVVVRGLFDQAFESDDAKDRALERRCARWLDALQDVPFLRTIETPAGRVGIAHTLELTVSWTQLEATIEALAARGADAENVHPYYATRDLPEETLWRRPTVQRTHRDDTTLPEAIGDITLVLTGHTPGAGRTLDPRERPVHRHGARQRRVCAADHRGDRQRYGHPAPVPANRGEPVKEIRTTIQARKTVCTASGFPETGFSTPHGWPPIPAPPPDSPLESERTRPAFEMFGAGRRRREFSDWSNVRTSAQSRARIETSRAQVP